MTHPGLTEYELHCSIIEYIDLTYPNIYYYSDMRGVFLHGKTAKDVARTQMKNGRKWLDLFIVSREIIGAQTFSGLFLEIKLDRYGKKGYLNVDGTLRKHPHIQAQWQAILYFRAEGFSADFVGGWDEAIEMIDGYFDGTMKPFERYGGVIE